MSQLWSLPSVGRLSLTLLLVLLLRLLLLVFAHAIAAAFAHAFCSHPICKSEVSLFQTLWVILLIVDVSCCVVVIRGHASMPDLIGMSFSKSRMSMCCGMYFAGFVPEVVKVSLRGGCRPHLI